MNATQCYRFDLPKGVLIDGRSFVADVETLRAMAASIHRAVDPTFTAGDSLLERVAKHWQVNANDVRGKRRFQSLVYARWHFADLAVKTLGWSQCDVDRFFGCGKGTSSYGRREFHSLIKVEKAFREKVEAFKV